MLVGFVMERKDYLIGIFDLVLMLVMFYFEGFG